MQITIHSIVVSLIFIMIIIIPSSVFFFLVLKKFIIIFLGITVLDLEAVFQPVHREKSDRNLPQSNSMAVVTG